MLKSKSGSETQSPHLQTELPPELHIMVYDNFFDFGKVLKMKNTSLSYWYLAFCNNHRKLCPLNEHEVIEPGKRYSCRDVFTQQEKVIDAPNSRFDLLLVSKLVKAEAMPVLFDRNNFMFLSCASLHDFIDHAPSRYQHLTEITLNFTSDQAIKAFSVLAKDCLRLKRLNLVFDGSPRYSIRYSKGKFKLFKNAIGMNALLKLRGIEVLRLSGYDRALDASEGDFSLPLADEESVGPLLRQELMKPRPRKPLRKARKDPKVGN